MPVELRKRKAHQVPAEKPAPAKKTSSKEKVAKVAKKVKEAVAGKKEATKPAKAEEPKPAAAAPAAAKSDQVAVGETIDLIDFGGEVETNEGVKTTLKKLVDECEKGVVLFTYPKASTPGCKRAPRPRNSSLLART